MDNSGIAQRNLEETGEIKEAVHQPRGESLHKERGRERETLLIAEKP